VLLAFRFLYTHKHTKALVCGQLYISLLPYTDCYMQITIFGASGKVGQMVVARALENKYDVVAFVHSHNPFKESERLHIVKGDVSDVSAVKEAITGSSAVISTLGSWHTKQKNALTSGMQTIIPAMESLDVSRLVTVTGSGAFYSVDTPHLIDTLNHRLLLLIAPKIVQDSEAHLAQLAASSLAWTSVRAPVMTNGHSAKYSLRKEFGSPLASIPRTALVQCLIDQLSDTAWLRQAPIIFR
jgi:putative NADH-flavin reductase